MVGLEPTTLTHLVTHKRVFRTSPRTHDRSSNWTTLSFDRVLIFYISCVELHSPTPSHNGWRFYYFFLQCRSSTTLVELLLKWGFAPHIRSCQCLFFDKEVRTPLTTLHKSRKIMRLPIPPLRSNLTKVVTFDYIFIILHIR